jgi:hypothetical protein
MATIKQVRDLLADRLSAQLGTYTFSNSQTKPAVFVRGSQQRPADVKISGIELTIDETSEDYVRPLVGAGAMVTMSWKLTLTQYNRSTTLSVVKTRLIRVFPDLMNLVHVPQSETMYEQITCLIPDYALQAEIL